MIAWSTFERPCLGKGFGLFSYWQENLANALEIWQVKLANAVDNLNGEMIHTLESVREGIHEGVDNRGHARVLRAYGMQMSNAGRILSKCSEVLKCNIRIAECEVELVEINKELMECEHGECADCERKDVCKVMKRLRKIGLAEG